MAPPGAAPLSFGEKLHMTFVVLGALGSLPLALLKWPFHRSSSLLSFALCAAFRSWFTNITSREMQSVSTHIDEVYTSFAKSRQFDPSSTILEDGTKGHWLGSKDAKTIIIYICGGAYMNYGAPAHMTFLYDLFVHQPGSDCSVLVLAYDVAPQAPFPRQLQQFTAMLGHLIDSMGHKPSDVMIGGDSSGGHAVLTVLSHLSHPHPRVPKLTLSEPLAGAFMISPLVSFDHETDYAKARALEPLDMIPMALPQKIKAAFLAGQPADKWNDPIKAPSGWWSGLKVKDLLITGGRDETLGVDIEALSKRLQNEHARTTVVLSDREAHVAIITDVIGLMSKTRSESGQAIEAWVAERTKR